MRGATYEPDAGRGGAEREAGDSTLVGRRGKRKSEAGKWGSGLLCLLLVVAATGRVIVREPAGLSDEGEGVAEAARILTALALVNWNLLPPIATVSFSAVKAA
jgi:hypothetical protein